MGLLDGGSATQMQLLVVGQSCAPTISRASAGDESLICLASALSLSRASAAKGVNVSLINSGDNIGKATIGVSVVHTRERWSRIVT